ncbi:DNA/RNA-binding protein KIN17-like isoform X2 [Gigantopelta aegis]|uniref:DNA/RNA-binding protein KIN17-like isoform X2 n=1 Tax=Gigantopelta aegis TaxID=1735272 RepID=UPI001B88905F|nr:DNA/RNA-binding protein KIN17-like isoform X2 [Gigantopelta aegis]
MGKEKGGFLTPKAIANRIKAKGLQKLRWYCQMCQKQCRDENGFKCHMMSESHQRQLLLFAENPDEYVDTFSKDFEEDYLELLRRRFGTKRVHANIVYQEYINNRDHVHMNSTMWETLTDFVKWVGKEGKCIVDYTEKGWFVAYIDRNPEAIKLMESKQKKEKMDLDDEEKTAKFIQQQIEKAAYTEKNTKLVVEFTELQREDDDEKVTFSLGQTSKKTEDTKIQAVDNPFKKPVKPEVKKPKHESRWDPVPEEAPSSSHKTEKVAQKRKAKSALDEIMEFEEQKREKMNRKDYWLHPGIVVKIVSKKLGDKYYKKKAYVKEVQDLYAGLIKTIDEGVTLRVDQTHVETVIPAIGKPVLIVNGAYYGTEKSRYLIVLLF